MPSGTLRVRRRSLGAVVRIGYLLVGVYGGGVFAGAERVSRFLQKMLNHRRDRVRGTKNAPRDWGRFRHHRYGLAQIVECGAVGFVKRLPVLPPHLEREFITLASAHASTAAATASLYFWSA